jgi:hypothetical protein
MFCKQSEVAEISYFVEWIENKKTFSAKIVGQGNENNRTDTVSANAPASSPRPGISSGLSVPVSEDERINFQNCIIHIYNK